MIDFKTTTRQRAASKRWYEKNRRRHIEAVKARYRVTRRARREPDGLPPMSTAEIQQRAAVLFGTVAEI